MTTKRETGPLDAEAVQGIAELARLEFEAEAIPALAQELSAILGFVEQLNGVDTQGVAPLTSVVGSTLAMRSDQVTVSNQVDAILENAPDRVADFFAVPKMVE